MVPKLFEKDHAMVDAAQAQLSVAILMPFEPKIMSKAKIEARLKNAVKQVEKELFLHFPAQIVKQAVLRLKTLLANLDYSTHKKSIAIFLSPFMEKLYYWNIPVQEKVVVGHSITFRDLIRSKPEEKAYLLVVLTASNSRIYLGNGEKLTRLVSDSSGMLTKDAEPAADDQRVVQRRLLRQFLRYFDNSLSILLQSYPLPVLVMGSEEVTNCFAKTTRNSRYLTKTINCTLDYPIEDVVLQEVRPYISNWDELKQQYLMRELDHALNEGKLAVGMTEVWAAAKDRKGRLLLVEEDYVFPAYLDNTDQMIYADAIPINEAVQVNDAVNDAMEKVLADGGDVEVVKKGTLKDYLHIALILH